MRSRLVTILGVVAVVALSFLAYSCGTQPNCPTCGTTVNGAYTAIDIIPVPEHNPTGEPGGPFNSFDISWFDPNKHLVYTSDRIGLAVVVTDTVQNAAVNVIEGFNGVTNAGNSFSPCWGPQLNAADVQAIPSIVTGLGSVNAGRTGSGLTRFGCRNSPFFSNFGNAFPGFGPNGSFGGFPGAQCCASRANGVNPISGPDGLLVTPDGKTLFVGSGSASVVVFDLTVNPPTVIGDFPTGSSPDFDGPVGVAPCIASWNGGAGSDPTCADDRADEMAYGTVGGRDILAIANGDPSLPFVTLIDVTDMVNRTFTPPFTGPGQGHCLPVNYPAYPTNGTAANNYTPTNPPACILGQIYYDGTGTQNANVALDTAGNPCPDPSTSVPSGVSGGPFALVATGGTLTIPCHHAPIVDQNTGAFVTNNGTTANPAAQNGEIAVAGTGALAFNPFHGTFYVENLNCTLSTLATQSSVAVGCIDEIDPRIGNANGPVVINVIPALNCMPAGIVQGPGHDFLVGCGGHDGVQFPPLAIIFDGMTSKVLATTDQTGGTDEVWYNPGDNRYYTAGRDMPNGPVMGVIDAGTRTWLVNVPTNSNSHSITADQFTNHIFVPSQSGGLCKTQTSNGCIAVFGRQ